MSFRSKVDEISTHSEVISTHIEGISTHSEESSTKTKKQEPRYIFIGLFAHGLYNYRSNPYKANEHASVSIETFYSVPKLMTFMNCSPGNSLIGLEDSLDNVALKDYFLKNSDFDIMDINKFVSTKAKTEEKIISNNFLGYVNSALDELEMKPRSRNELFKKANPTDIDLCRNTLICNDKVGISHHFVNKSFSTFDSSTSSADVNNWGGFIYNNNCGIEPGTNIEEIFEIDAVPDYDKDGKKRGFIYYLDDIIKGLTKLCRLTEDDYLFLFDYSCNGFSKTSVNPEEDSRLIRRLARNVETDLGFVKKKGGTRKNKKLKKKKLKTRKLKRTKSVCKNKRKG
jgi:hypothetical protein